MMWLFFALLSAVTAALVAIFGKLGLSKIDTTLATTLRSFVMSVVLLVVAVSLKKFQGFSFHLLSNREWVFIILAGLAGALSWLFYFAALKYGLASRVAAVDRLSLVFVFVFALFFLGETLHWQSALGALLAIGGIILMTI